MYEQRQLRPGHEQAELGVPDTADGQRLDVFLSGAFAEVSRVHIQRCIRSGLVLVNGRPSRPAEKLSAGDRVHVAWPDRPSAAVLGEDIPFEILFEDDDIVVVNKPPGLVVHPTDNCRHGTLVNALIHHDEDSFLREEDDPRPGIVHRLDKDTSGVMVVAKHPAARHRLKESFKARDVEKTYLTIVIGEFGAVTGRIETLMGRHPVARTRMAVLDEDGKPAITNYRVLGTANDCSLLEVRIETGRTHQIRVHFAHLRHPVLGDGLYGGRQRGVGVEVERQMLHAWKLVFPHPTTGVKRQYMAPLPADFVAALRALGLPVIGEHLEGHAHPPSGPELESEPADT